MERLSGPLSRNTSVNHDFIADNFTRSRARRDRRRRRVDDDESQMDYLKLAIAPLAPKTHQSRLASRNR